MDECPICAAPSDAAFETRYVHVNKCWSRQCGHLFAVGAEAGHGVMHETDSDEVARLYERRNRGLVDFWRRRGFLGERSRLLDIGSGTGHVVQSVRALLPDVRISCIEESEVLSTLLEQRGFEISKDLASLAPDREFDAILLMEVIEHVPDPVGFLAGIRPLLAPRGRIFLTTPCGELRTGSRRTNAYDTPEHVQFFVEDSLRLAVYKAGFAGIRYEYIDSLYPVPGEVMSTAYFKRCAMRAIMPVLIRLRGPRHLTGFIQA
jgi:SAM-dependent methyltransferase